MKVYISKNRGFDNISDNLYGYAYCGENHCIGFIIFVNGKYHFDQCSNHLSFGRIKARPARKIEKLQRNIEKAIRQDSFFFALYQLRILRESAETRRNFTIHAIEKSREIFVKTLCSEINSYLRFHLVHAIINSSKEIREREEMKVYISKNKGFGATDNLVGYAYCGENHCIGFIIFANGKYYFDQCSNHLSLGKLSAKPARKLEKLQRNIEKALCQGESFF